MTEKYPNSVLIVDDDEEIRFVVRNLLENLGCNVFEAGDGEEALTVLDKGIDLILVDLMMPKMDGLELLRQMRIKNIYVPSIIVTGYGSRETTLEAQHLGVFGFVEKPFIKEDLATLIAEALESSANSRYPHYDHLLSPIIAINHEYRIVYFNNAFTSFIRRSPRKLNSQLITQVIDDNGGELTELLAECFEKRQPVISPEIAITCGDETRDVILKLTPPSGDAQDLVLNFRDYSVERSLNGKYNERLAELKQKNDKIREYSVGLERLVDERTRDLRRAKEEIEGIIHSIREGIFVVEPDLTIGSQFSDSAQHLLETDELEGKQVLEVMFPDGGAVAGSDVLKKFEDFFASVFVLLSPSQFEMLANILPQTIRFPNAEGSAAGVRLYSFSVSPVIEDDEIARLIVAVRDDTELDLLRNHQVLAYWRVGEALAQFHDLTKRIATVRPLKNFLLDAMKRIGEINGVSGDLERIDPNIIFRHLHTIKGNCRQFGLDYLQHFTHEAESLLEKQRGTVRSRLSDDDKIDFNRNLKMIEKCLEAMAGLMASDDPGVGDGLAEWVNYVMLIQMSVDALASEQGKKIGINVVSSHALWGKDLRFLSGIITHLVRNSIDHGIETPESRRSAGKSTKAKISINIDLHEDQFYCRVVDDGAGLDLQRVRAKAIEKGLLPEDHAPIDAEAAVELITSAGFSTRDGVSEISGRGVGLDFVKATVESCGGTLKLQNLTPHGIEFVFNWKSIEFEHYPLASSLHHKAA